ncbi:hypothetical protein KKY53_14800 [Pseudomonas aeruginosa]|uniref:hypothetical protein n=1 Tax=Pseudomonas aeruginosa TaxID=287 RepID=UPI00053D0E27|nr:hypothetical protein [Pseudomonas aeruginosa]WCV81756.1 hypothetical protein KKY53_14800 [Pseudomonas aeruginosa]HBO0862803.1 hypothetical protein [Pseudomonas aeruginosa]HBO1242439.1 hypothetical protein [Pseudomonas aeruginosa]HBO1880102.1 hypothetical protein [Pseudomonas aeruginosa]HBO2083323.1 hypothetical protein [Pseudomonas aeruginosa]
MPDIREEFEAWATKHRMPIHRDGVVTDYAARCTDECWQAWKASRAALRVELPPTITAEEVVEHFNIDEEGIDMAAGIAHMVNGAIWSCAAFIKQAGIEVK